MVGSGIQSISFALDIVSFRGIYFFCGGVWLSLFLSSIVEHYQRHLILEHVLVKNETEDPDENEKPPHPFRAKVFLLSGVATLPILAFLIVSVVVPLLEKRINGVLPFLIAGFGWIPDPNLAPILVDVDYGTMLEYITAVQGSGAKFMVREKLWSAFSEEDPFRSRLQSHTTTLVRLSVGRPRRSSCLSS